MQIEIIRKNREQEKARLMSYQEKLEKKGGRKNDCRKNICRKHNQRH